MAASSLRETGLRRSLVEFGRVYARALWLLRNVGPREFRDRVQNLIDYNPLRRVDDVLFMNDGNVTIMPLATHLLEMAQSVRPHVPEHARRVLLTALEKLERDAREWEERHGGV